MQLISTITLALAIVTSTLLSTTLAVPTPQMVGSLGEPEGSIIERRQCVGSSTGGEGREGSAPDCLVAQPRQMLGASVEEGDVESRQVSNHVSGPESPDSWLHISLYLYVGIFLRVLRCSCHLTAF